MFKNKKALLLDMNSTFMFGEDRFGESEDFSSYYAQIGGMRPSSEINQIIRSAYAYLEVRYPDEKYRHHFPTLKSAIDAVLEHDIDEAEMNRIIETFAFHERGDISDIYQQALVKLHERFTLAVVIDIWSPKTLWLEYFDTLNLMPLFSAQSFSSDHGMVKPSPKPFQQVLADLGLPASLALVIGDSARRDLGGARAAKIDCVLVGGANHPDVVACYDDLLAFCRVVQ